MSNFNLTTGVPGVDLALGIASRVYNRYKQLSKHSESARHIVRQIATAGLAERLSRQVGDVCAILEEAGEAAIAATPLQTSGGSLWLSKVFNGTKRFVFSGSIGDALNEVNKRLDRSIQLLQASLAVDTKEDTKAIREAQAAESARLGRIEMQLKNIAIGGAAAAQPLPPVHTAELTATVPHQKMPLANHFGWVFDGNWGPFIRGDIGEWRWQNPRALVANVNGRKDLKDADFIHFRGLCALNMNQCDQVTITDAAFQHLRGIHTLDMSYCFTITDAAFESRSV